MATNEEILNSRILGFIEPLGNNARVTVLAYKNATGDYVIFEKNKAKSIFYPDGKVFAGKFQFDRDVNPISPYSFIEFSVTPSPKSADFEGDDYIVDYDYNKKYLQKSFIQIVPVTYQTSLEHGFITQDELFSCIDKNQIQSLGTSFFLKLNNSLYGLFKYENSTNSIRPALGTETKSYELNDYTFQSCCLKFNDKEYYIGNVNAIPFRQTGIIDCMDDKQLAKWFKELLKTTADSEKILFLSKKVFQNFASHYKETNVAIDEIRLERIKGKLDSFEFTKEEIEEIVKLDSPLVKSFKDSFNKEKADFHEAWAKDGRAKLQLLNQQIENLEKKNSELTQNKDNLLKKIANLANDYKSKTDELEKSIAEKREELEKSISEIEAKYTTLQTNYDSMIEEMKIILSVNTPKPIDTTASIEPICFCASGKTYTYLDENEGYGFFNLLKENLELESIPDVVKEQLKKDSVLFTYKAVFVPNISWAYLYAKAIRNSKLYILHVEHDWLHYRDFLNNGLLDVLNSCEENKDINHVLVFDSLNLTQPECGLKPLLDVVSGYSLVIPQFNKVFPENLKIFATILPFSDENKIGLPLNKDSFVAWGQIATPSDKIILDSDFLTVNNEIGYFEPKDIQVKANKRNEQGNNGYFAE